MTRYENMNIRISDISNIEAIDLIHVHLSNLEIRNSYILVDIPVRLQENITMVDNIIEGYILQAEYDKSIVILIPLYGSMDYRIVAASVPLPRVKVGGYFCTWRRSHDLIG